MKTSNRAFTLIELLVVILIIGILAAIALPQYQKAVEKSKAIEGMTLARTVGQSAYQAYLINGRAPTNFSQLDIMLPSNLNGNTKGATFAVLDTRSNKDWSIQLAGNTNTTSAVANIVVTRLSGPYKGAGFLYIFSPYIHFDTDQRLWCTERKSFGTIFNKTPGDFCKKFFHGTELVLKESGNNSYRAYTLAQ